MQFFGVVSFKEGAVIKIYELHNCLLRSVLEEYVLKLQIAMNDPCMHIIRRGMVWLDSAVNDKFALYGTWGLGWGRGRGGEK